MANTGIPLINGQRPAWAQMRVNILGRPITGLVSIDYKSTRKKENHYGSGDEVDHRGYGNREYEVSLTLYKYEVDAILALLGPGQDLTDVAPFDIPLQWLDQGNTKINGLVIKDYEFTETGASSSQNDTKVEMPCGGICSKIIFNAK